MTAKANVIRKRLISAGLSAEACTKYFETFRAFLSARLTKVRFEDEMLKILPREKIHVHNEIIQEILFHAQQRREGLRDLPVVTPIRDRKPALKRPPTVKPTVQVKTEPKTAKVGNKRPLEDSESTTTKGTVHDDTGNKRIKRNVPKKINDIEKAKPPKTKIPEKPSPKPRRRPDNSINLPPPSPASQGPPRVQPTRGGQTQPAEIPTYDVLPYFPVRPGQAMDIDLFLKLRQRMKRVAVEQSGMSGLKDDAVSLMVHAVEAHVKSLLEAAVRQRAARDGLKPQKNLQCGPVRGYDIRESALHNPALFGDESGMDLERLLLLL